MKRILAVLVVFVLAAMSFLQSPAQSRMTPKAEDDQDNDQVIEMLDSLVNIKYISRISLKKQSTRNTFQPNDIPTYSDDVMKQRLARLQSPIPLVYNDQVKKYIELYVNRRRELSSITLGLARLYFPMFEQVLDTYGLPLELKYLAVVESALNPMAVSRVGATGLWQFMYNTGKVYNLEINSFVDERRDVYRSTVAACQYLKEMYSIYHDWLLVIASYNCGPGNVNKAIIRSGGKTTFWEIAKYLPKETRGYVPAFIAVNYMMNYATEHNIAPIPSVISFLELDTVNVNRKLSLLDVAASVGVSAELIRFLNPIYKKNYIPYAYDSKPFKLILPANKVAVFLTNSENIYKGGNLIPDVPAVPVITRVSGRRGGRLIVQKAVAAAPDAKPADAPAKEVVKDVRKVHIVRKGDDMETIADRFECSIEELKKWNHMKTTKLRNGQRVIIYLSSDTNNRTMTYTEDQSTDESAQVSAKSKIKYIYHVVQRGDTLRTIAKRYTGVTVEQLKQINNIHSSSKQLKPGTKIKVALMA